MPPGAAALGEAGAAALLRAAWYAGGLGGAGLAFFALTFGARLDAKDAARLRRWAAAAALLGLASGLGALAAAVTTLAGGGGRVLDADLWGLVLASPAGRAYGLGAMGLLLIALLARGPRWAGAAAAGGALVCASHLLAGHTLQASHRPLLAGLLLLHLLAAAFWIGSLPPLAWAARRGGDGAARLVADWARAAALGVPLLLAAGLGLAWGLAGGVGALLGSRYGWALLAKAAPIALMLGLAVRHSVRLTPALAAGAPGAGRRLARSVAVKAVLALLVLGAAAALVSAPPSGRTAHASD